MSKPKCVYVFQFDEIRPDHLSVYGYHRKQKYIEDIAKDGVVFNTNISGSSYTGAATPILWTGMMAPHTGVRDPYQVICVPLIQEYISKMNWATQGAMSQSIAASCIGMNKGFDNFIEPTDADAPDVWADSFEHLDHLGIKYDKERSKVKPIGKWYVDENTKFIKKCADEGKPFYLYNQFYETHTGSADYLIRTGKIKEGIMAENEYYDAKIKLADEEVIGKVIKTLKEVGLYNDALIVILSDHGTSLREECWPMGDYIYEPSDVGDIANTHSSLYDVDLKTPLIIKSPNLPENCIGKRIDGQVRSIDIAPTILDLLGVSIDNIKPVMDGESLVPYMKKLIGHGKLAYAETVWSGYGMGSRQMLRENNWKYIRYLSSMTEEFFDLKKDPIEQNNLINRLRFHAPKWLKELREEVNELFRAEPKGIERPKMDIEEQKAIGKRLEALGYIQKEEN